MNSSASYRLPSFSIIIIFFCFIIIGSGVIPLLNIQLNPSRSLPNISVSFSWPEASSQVVEQEVTSRLEGMFSAVRELQSIESVSYKGYGRINLTFKKNTDLQAARFEIASLIRQSYSELPEMVSYPEISMNLSGDKIDPILTYRLNASASPYFIQKYAEDNIVQELAGTPGLGQVNVYGASPFEWVIEYDAQRVQKLGLTATNIAAAVNQYFGVDYLGQGPYLPPGKDNVNEITLSLHTEQPDSLNWNAIPVEVNEERIIFLGDIANVSYRERPADNYFRINGLNTINLVVYPEKGVNIINVAKDVKREIEHIRQSLPPGYSILLAYDATEFMQKELNKIGLRTIFSLALLLIFVLIVSRRFRYLLLIGISVLANLIIACAFYYLFNIEIHLYSLAGITISFGIIIDNSIIMIDHIRSAGNRKAFLAVLAATLTTIGALSIVFFLADHQKLNLIDFAIVIIVNLSVSLLVALFFIPALMDKIRLRSKKGKVYIRRKKRVLRITSGYLKFILWGKRWKWAFIVILVLGFGIPIHWLPKKIEKETGWAQLYNKTLGSSWYVETAGPLLQKILGGSLRLFTEHVYESSFYAEPSQTTLYVRGSMPEGCTVEQLNEAIEKMENFISQFDEVSLFETSISGYRNSNIRIQFKEEHERGSFPYFLKGELESKAINLGGLDWSVYGVGRGFSNALHSGYRSNAILLYGYNYDELYYYAQLLKATLLENSRIKEVDIAGTDSWQINVLHEYFLTFDDKRLRINQVSRNELYHALRNKVNRIYLNPIFNNNESQPVALQSDQYKVMNVWDLRERPIAIDSAQYKLAQFGQIEKQKTGNDIYKLNQEYQLAVAYDFIGPSPLASRVEEKHIKEMNEILPLGYSAKSRTWYGWNKDDKNQYYLILLVILIIYFICSILLESFTQPLAIVLMIPISFIGVFLTFYFFDFNFDQGGFASFILLSGLTVNAGLYIINDYNNYLARFPHKPSLSIYLKAYNHKIMPILLTLLSTILGLVPFIWGGQKEVFWFAFAVGSIGGLVFSIAAILIYLPLFMKLTIKKSSA